MRVFTHGCINDFQQSAREMFVRDLSQLIGAYIDKSKSVLFGSIDLEKEELFIYGHLQRILLDEKNNKFEVSLAVMEEDRIFTHSLDHFIMSHDASFNIIDENSGEVFYQVIYLTFYSADTQGEISYFLADLSISEPLAVIAEFWEHVTEVGRDVDFSIVGCCAKKLKI